MGVLKGGKDAVVAGLEKGRALPPLTCPILTLLPPHPRLCGGGGGEASALREAMRARARGVHTRVRARFCRRVFVYFCVCTWVCSCDPVEAEPSVCVLHACGGKRVDCACACTAVCIYAQGYVPVWVMCARLHWVEGAVRTGRFAHVHMHVNVQTGVCVSVLCTECIRPLYVHTPVRMSVCPAVCT